MTDMTAAKKQRIRYRAKHFALDLRNAPFDSGLSLYQNTINELYDGSSRIRLCLKCGEIDAATKLKKENHSCALDFKSFQVLVTTSWKELEDFFLTQRYAKALESIGVDSDIREIVTVPSETTEEIPTSVKEIQVTDALVTEK